MNLGPLIWTAALTLLCLRQAFMPAWNSFTGKVFVIKAGKHFIIINICRIIIIEKCLFSHTILFFFFFSLFVFLLLVIIWVDRLISIFLQRGRLSPSVPLLHDAPGNHVIQPSLIPDASSGTKEETQIIVRLTSK